MSQIRWEHNQHHTKYSNNNFQLDDVNVSQAQEWQNGIHNVWLQANAKTCKHISLGFWQQSYTTTPTSQISRWAPRLQSHIWKTHKTKIKSSNVTNFTKIKAKRPSLNATACITLVLMLCISHLDYSNAMIYRITKKLLQKYQRIQNMCAKLILNICKYNSATECLQ